MNDDATTLERAWCGLAAAALMLAALCALVVAAARVPQAAAVLDLRPYFGQALVLHVGLATLVWLLAAACTLWTALAPPRAAIGWPLFGAAAAGVVCLLAAAAAAGRHAQALLFSYVPLLDDARYRAGLSVFLLAVGGVAAASLRHAWQQRGAPTALSPAAYAVRAGLLPAFVAPLVLGLGWVELNRAQSLAAQGELLFWAPGHVLQFLYSALLVAAWLRLARHPGSAEALPRSPSCSPRSSLPAEPQVPCAEARQARSRCLPELPPARASGPLRAAIVMTVAPVVFAPLILFLFPIDSASFRAAFTSLMAWGSWPGPLWVAWQIARAPACAPACGAQRGFLVGSIGLFVAGLLAGAVIDGESTTIPAHYHGTVGAVTLALMGVVHERLGALQTGGRERLPLVFGGGLALVLGGFAIAGAAGLPRKAAFADASAPAAIGIVVMAIGAALAIIAALWFGARVTRVLKDAAVRWARRRRHATSGVRAADRRGVALAATVASIALLGGLVAWSGNASRHEGATALPGLSTAQAAEVRRRFDQGVVMLHARRYEYAIAAFGRVLELAPQMPEAHVNLGYALLGSGQPRTAADFFSAAIALRQGQLNAYYGLAVALDEAGDRAAALGAMRTFTHLARADDPFRRKAEAALWEWEAASSRSDAERPRR